MKVFSIVFAGLITSTLVLAGGNGGGYNGPDLNPVSIPVSLERGISLTAVGDAIRVCTVTGDKESGLQSIAQKFAAQLGATVKVDSNAYAVSSIVKDRVNFNESSIGLLTPGNDFPDRQMAVGNLLSNGEDQWSVFGVTLMWGSDSYLQTPSGTVFPYVIFDQKISEGTYDDFGNLQKETVLLGGLKIVAAVPEGQSLASLPLINTRSNVASKFTINGEEYIQCLQAELQKRAAL